MSAIVEYLVYALGVAVLVIHGRRRQHKYWREGLVLMVAATTIFVNAISYVNPSSAGLGPALLCCFAMILGGFGYTLLVSRD